MTDKAHVNSVVDYFIVNRTLISLTIFLVGNCGNTLNINTLGKAVFNIG